MKKIAITTYGCSLNTADSEIIASQIDKSNFKIIDDESESDIVIINTCTVKGPTDTKIKRHIKRLKEENKKVVLAGCFVQAQPELVKEKYNVSAIGTKQFNKINHVLSSNEKKIFTDTNNKIPKKTYRFDSFREIVPISRGCLGSCTYCITKFARGKLDSRNPDEIISQIKKAVNEGIKEIWITAEDNFIYGLDKDYSIYSLLKRIDKIEGNFFTRIGMANPKAYKIRKEEVIKSLHLIKESDKFYNFLHLPLQSANNRVLEKMDRGYKFEEIIGFFDLAKKLNFTISTDIICGFPTETDKEFQDSIEFIKKLKPDFLNISRYWPRPKTKASKLKHNGRITKKRSRELTEVYNKLAEDMNDLWVGKETKVLLNDKKSNAIVARNIEYKPVVVKNKELKNKGYNPKDMLGKFINVKIDNSTKDYLNGKIIEKNK
ncbi:MAG: tRNA (N(6)-L-threonylcarbamoyladenosine(37)-C(2))-methylthiotransferase [Candidatus Woesearchaeota archaeon]